MLGNSVGPEVENWIDGMRTCIEAASQDWQKDTSIEHTMEFEAVFYFIFLFFDS